MSNISINNLLEAGVQFGHQTKKWNPKMKPYIFGSRNGIYIIDLQKTLKLLKDATEFMKETASNGKRVIFVGTKKQAQDIIKNVAEQCGAHYINQRWLGGTLTNFETIEKSLKKMRDIEAIFADEKTLAKYKKKEQLNLTRKLTKLQKYFGGIKDLKGLPDAIFIVDPRKDKIALQEAVKIGIPVVAMVDTNCNPDNVSYVIPSNDDAVRSIQTIVGAIGNAVQEGTADWNKKQAELAKLKEAKKAAATPKAAEAAPAKKAAAPKKAAPKADEAKAEEKPKKAETAKKAAPKADETKAEEKPAPKTKAKAKTAEAPAEEASEEAVA